MSSACRQSPHTMRNTSSLFKIILLSCYALDRVSSFCGKESFPRRRHENVALSSPTVLTSYRSPVLSEWSAKSGDTALRQVQFLASRFVGIAEPKSVQGTGGMVYNNPEFNRGVLQNGEERASILSPNLEISTNAKREEQVWTALANLELDSKSSIGFTCTSRQIISNHVPTFVKPHTDSFLLFSATVGQSRRSKSTINGFGIDLIDIVCRSSRIWPLDFWWETYRISSSFRGSM